MIDLRLGDCLEAMKSIESNTIDSVVTDPPAGISFMGKSWDSDKGGRDNWIKWMQEVATECLRVLKPGGHAFVWALPRTSHWTATAWENAGFDVREIVSHIFGSGFPKSHNIGKSVDKLQGNEREDLGESENNRDRSKHEYNSVGNVGSNARLTKGTSEWEGWGTNLKPAREDWLLLRKPIEKGLTIAENCLKWRVGGINIDESRIDVKSEQDKKKACSERPNHKNHNENRVVFDSMNGKGSEKRGNPQGRFPANIILGADEDGVHEEVRECFPESKGQQGDLIGHTKQRQSPNGCFGKMNPAADHLKRKDSGSASRFFKSIIYAPKASKKERNAGCDTQSNNHSTVKSIKLMEYLITMITPTGGTVLDPFLGSGSTGVACVNLNRNFIGIELNEDYLGIAKNRVETINESKTQNKL